MIQIPNGNIQGEHLVEDDDDAIPEGGHGIEFTDLMYEDILKIKLVIKLLPNEQGSLIVKDVQYKLCIEKGMITVNSFALYSFRKVK